MSNESINRMLAIAAVPPGAIPERARRLAGLSLFDWFVVARAGVSQPMSVIIRDFLEEEGGRATATVAGSGKKLPARAAALANGTISHALDYDDTHFAHIGHLSVGILPAALAVGEEVDAAAGDVRDAFLLGAEAACRIGMVLGRVHYQRGFHQTATAGAFGAAISAAQLYGLDAAQIRQALSLVSTRASGLKSQFGTMGKPFNAGIAAANGVEAAALARGGFISCDDGIGGLQGFVDTHSDAPDHEGPWQNPPPRSFLFEDIKYKLHACCHGTHAMIEALLAARRRQAMSAADVTHIDVRTHSRWLRVCDIKAPRTGLEAKFSYGMLAAMVLHGIDTASDASYTDALCVDPALHALARRVEVAGDDSLTDMQCDVRVVLAGGRHAEGAYDLAAAMPDDALANGLRNKARALLGTEPADRLWSTVAAVDRLSARELARFLVD